MATTDDLNTMPRLPGDSDTSIPRPINDNLTLPTDIPRPINDNLPLPTDQTTAIPFDFNTLSDDDLMSLASLLGLDSSAFLGGNAGNMGDMFQIDPAVADAVSRVYQAQRQLGGDELKRKAVESSGARGLNMSDTPVSDPYMRGQALLESQLRGNEAASLLGIGTDWAKHRDTMFSSLYNGDANRNSAEKLGMMSLFNTGGQIGLGLNSGSGSMTNTQSQGGVNMGGLGLIGEGLSGLGSSGVGSWLGGLFGGGGGATNDNADFFDIF